MLTTEQIKYLFAFCKKHYVHHYDVQVELVDHLANAIEEKMDADKQISFENALNSVYAGFGIMGFSKIVKARTRMVNSRCTKLRRNIFFSYFTWPKAAMTVCMLLGMALLPKLLSGEVLFYLTIVIGASLCIYERMVYLQIKELWKKQKQPLLMTEPGLEEPFFTLLFLLQIAVPLLDRGDFLNRTPQTVYIIYLIAMITIVVCFVTTLAYKQFVEKLEKEARMHYPEAFEIVG